MRNPYFPQLNIETERVIKTTKHTLQQKIIILDSVNITSNSNNTKMCKSSQICFLTPTRNDPTDKKKILGSVNITSNSNNTKSALTTTVLPHTVETVLGSLKNVLVDARPSHHRFCTISAFSYT